MGHFKISYFLLVSTFAVLSNAARHELEEIDINPTLSLFSDCLIQIITYDFVFIPPLSIRIDKLAASKARHSSLFKFPIVLTSYTEVVQN